MNGSVLKMSELGGLGFEWLSDSEIQNSTVLANWANAASVQSSHQCNFGPKYCSDV